MNEKLKKLFDFQKFAHNEELENLMAAAENRRKSMLTDEELFSVSAAGVDYPTDNERNPEKLN